MNKFTITELRADVDNYIREIMCGTFYYFETQAAMDETINFLIAALIGNTEYEFLNEYRFAVVEFIPVTQDTQLILRLS